MRKKKLKFLQLIFIVLIGGSAFLAGVLYEQHKENYLSFQNSLDFTLLNQIVRKLEEKFVNDLDYQKMLFGAAKGLVKSVGDDYTEFFDPEEAKIFKEDISGSFEGVGMEIGIRNNQLTVITPLEGTPAFRAGILPKDIILKIDGEDTSQMTLEEAAKKIRGKKGTKVVLTIYREGWDKPRDFEIIRDLIIIPALKFEVLDGNIGYLKIYQFSQNISYQFQKAAQEIERKKINKIILDLRNNPGGILTKAQEIAGWFLEKGDTVLYERESNGEEKEHRAKGNSKFLKHKIVVLVNQGTASAAEILAAALKENRSDIILVGEKTFGKGSVQEVIDLKYGALLKVTIAYWLTPSKKMIDKQGLVPDIEVPMEEEDYLSGKDPQLQKALQIIKSL